VQIINTIVALATPPGRGGIGVIRLSGTRSLEIARALIQDKNFKAESHHVVLKRLHDPRTGEILDHALLTFFKSPHSFTGEDVVELSCHGSPVLLRYLIDVILSFDARLAGPGEFTLRALSNGRLNLSQAEAIRDLINAQTKAAAQQAVRQLGGELSRRLTPIENTLLEIIIPLESSLEFVEDDLPEVSINEIKIKLSGLIKNVEVLASTFNTGRLLRDGLKITLAGRPNVGKSSLFNGLLAHDRAIVTDIPGTTRDSLVEVVNIKGVPVLLTDTAGLRDSTDKVESLGVERTRHSIADSDLVVIVLDGSQPFIPEDKAIFNEIAAEISYLIALNKSDLGSFKKVVPEELNNKPTTVVSVSAKTGAGLDELRAAILEPFAKVDTNETGILVTDARHFDLLQRTVSDLKSSLNLLEQRASEEIVLVGLYNSLRFLGEITGETTPDDVLSQIFATFCIGK
jgi:tRNA modification GTPase